jgi:hypothetical protein
MASRCGNAWVAGMPQRRGRKGSKCTHGPAESPWSCTSPNQTHPNTAVAAP